MPYGILTRCRPKIIIREPNNSVKTGASKPPKTLPVTAQKTPIIPRTNDKPREKEKSLTNSLIPEVFSIPQIYAKSNGNAPIEHGEIEEIIPPRKDISNT